VITASLSVYAQDVRLYSSIDEGRDVELLVQQAEGVISIPRCATGATQSAFSRRLRNRLIDYAHQGIGTIRADNVAVSLDLGPFAIQVDNIHHLRLWATVAQQPDGLACGCVGQSMADQGDIDWLWFGGFLQYLLLRGQRDYVMAAVSRIRLRNRESSESVLRDRIFIASFSCGLEFTPCEAYQDFPFHK